MDVLAYGGKRKFSEGGIAEPSQGGRLLASFGVLLAIIYASVLASLPIDIFKDRGNYFVYATASDIILFRYKSDGIFAFLANEPLWLYLNITLSKFLSAEEIVRTLIFAPAFLTSFTLLRQSPKNIIWVIIFLLAPIVVKNYVIHLRQGVAIAVFLCAYYSNWKFFRIPIMVSAAFIHSSFFFVLIILVFANVSERFRISLEMRVAVSFLLFTAISFALGTISAALGARQALVYTGDDLDVSGFSFVLWFLVLILFLYSGKGFVKRNLFSVLIIIFYLSAYFLIEVSGRIFESSVLIVLVSGLNLLGQRRVLFLGLVMFQISVTYITRWGEPWMGFGVL